jgi:hypothetical protein
MSKLDRPKTSFFPLLYMLWFPGCSIKTKNGDRTYLYIVERKPLMSRYGADFAK